MPIFWRIVLAIATFLTAAAFAVGSVISFATHAPPILGIVCILLTAGFGYFVYHDCQFFFGKKS